MFIRSQNVDLIADEPVYFSRRTVAGTTDTISVSFDSFSISYLLSEQNEELLVDLVEHNETRGKENSMLLERLQDLEYKIEVMSMKSTLSSNGKVFNDRFEILMNEF